MLGSSTATTAMGGLLGGSSAAGGLLGGLFGKAAGGGQRSGPASAAATKTSNAAQQGQNQIRPTVVMISGCQDDQTSADVSNVASFGLPSGSGPGGAGGACTNSMMKVLDAGHPGSWVDMLKKMRAVLMQKGYQQVPQLSCSKPLDMQAPFTVVEGHGRKKACLVGINYRGQKGELRGCINDVLMMQQYLKAQGFTEVRILTEDVALKPTYDNIITEGFLWLTAGAQPGDSLFFHYSGHGGQAADKSGEEADGMDETIIPLDYQQKGQIIDDIILQKLVMPLPEGCRLTVLMDCCHSGSVLDLPYTFTADGAHINQPHPQLAPNPKFNLNKLVRVGAKLMQGFLGM